MSSKRTSKGKRIRWTPNKIKLFFDSVDLLVDDVDLINYSYSQKINCICKRCKRPTSRSLMSIQSTGTKIGCQRCSMREKSQRSKKTDVQAEEILKSVGLKALVPYPGSQDPWLSECSHCKREVTRPLSDIVHAKKKWGITSACAFCNGNRVDERERLQLLEKFGLIPMERYINNKESHVYRCVKCGEITRQTFINIRRKVRSKANSFGCPKCSFDASGSRRAINRSDVYKRFRDLDLELIGEYKNARTLVNCICLKCHRNIRQTLNGVNNGKSCRFCSPKGIRYGDPSYLYLIRNINLNALKVGIGNQSKRNDRIHVHINRGWEVIDTWHFKTAEEAKIVEQAALMWIRQEKKLSAALSRRDMPQGGHSETFDLRQLSDREVVKKVNQIIKTTK